MRKRRQKKRKRRRKRKKRDESIVIVKAIHPMMTSPKVTNLVLDHHRDPETANEERKRNDQGATPKVEAEAVDDALVAGVEGGNQLLRYAVQDLHRIPALVHVIV